MARRALVVALAMVAIVASGIPVAAQKREKLKREDCLCGGTGCQCQWNSCGAGGAVTCRHRGCQKQDCPCGGRMCPKFQATAECHGTKPCKDGNQHCRLAPCNDEKDRDEDKDKKEQNQNQNPEGSPSAEAPAAGGGGGVAGAATGGGAAAGGGGGGAMLAVLGGVAAAASGIALGSALGGGGGDESDDCPSALDLAAQSGGAVIAIGDETICTPWTSCGSRSFRACIANYCSPNSCELYYDLSDGRSVTCSFNCGTGDTSGIYSCAERAAVACE